MRKFLPVCDSFRRMESVTAWPESEVPAALNVTWVWCFAAMGRMRFTSSSP